MRHCVRKKIERRRGRTAVTHSWSRSSVSAVVSGSAHTLTASLSPMTVQRTPVNTAHNTQPYYTANFLPRNAAANCVKCCGISVCPLAHHRVSHLWAVHVKTVKQPIVFTARRVRIARTTPWQAVCPSVRLSLRLSHAGIVDAAEHILKFFYSQVAPLF